MMPSDLVGQVALVTGASSGIGLAVARALASAGATVHAVARRPADGPFISHACDVTDRQAVQQLVSEAAQGSGIDACVLAAGTNVTRRRLSELGGEDWDRVVRTNLDGTYNALSAALPFLRERRGHAILVSSVSALWPDTSGVAYQASKAGVRALAQAAALEEHANGVRITTLFPGLVDTPLQSLRPVPPGADVLANALRPEDVAEACVWTLSAPQRVCVAELTILPTLVQSAGNTR